MFAFIQSQFLFYFAIILIFFIPGYSLFFALFGKKWPFSKLEAFFISFGLSIVITDFVMLILGRFGPYLNVTNIVLSIALFSTISGSIFFLWHRKKELAVELENKFPDFSKAQFAAVIVLIFLTFFIKTVYLQKTIMPTSTDLGHHMYWAKTISTTGEVPKYEKVDINIETSSLTEPEPIDDFIVGEHLIFAAINLISGIDFVSYFPSLILFLIHLMGILTMFMLTRLLFKDYKNANAISVIALLFIGPLYALASPQVKFVSGGVIGNMLGDFFIPLIIYLFLRALVEKNSLLLSLGIFISLGMAYTHHLSTFVFIFIFIFACLFFIIFNFKSSLKMLFEWVKLIFKPAPLIIILLSLIFIFSVYMPTYFNVKAIDTAVGTPSKATREGVTFSQLSESAGKIRMALGVFGIALLMLSKKRKSYASAFLLGWAISIMAISLKPGWFYIDIPSDRIADYSVFPFSIISGFAFVYFFELLKNSKEKKQYLNPNFILTAFLLIFTFSGINGLRENTATLNTKLNINAALETYNASEFLAKRTSDKDMILKDHNYVTADSWMKLYFMRGYTYPLSRGYFKRYEDETKVREQCTNLMISIPSGPEAKKCFTETKTNFLVVNPKYDSTQFIKIKNFWKVYSGEDISIFYKTN
ncbi:MAG: hypothetical protein WAV31_04280 [Candidatus Moraniibacteriota bacterium]